MLSRNSFSQISDWCMKNKGGVYRHQEVLCWTLHIVGQKVRTKSLMEA